ncbi:hypothetical protein [Marinobacter sp. AC-23]|uniref:hypothetical protein n=1 Tax=Marinobacter sp. AC-23 TaxID=1879031 RepID=UPI0015877FCA|nr:hypothetical protein [Marinobacter sp. AC-23]
MNVDIVGKFIATLAKAWLIILSRTHSEPALSLAIFEAAQASGLREILKNHCISSKFLVTSANSPAVTLARVLIVRGQYLAVQHMKLKQARKQLLNTCLN